jgi:adenine C2-methylase RlmN of 23S rRNA A2503 and tRNA A37
MKNDNNTEDNKEIGNHESSSDEEKRIIALSIKKKVRELNELIDSSNQQNLSIHIIQSSTRNKEDKLLYSTVGVNIFEIINY